jgi:hypothetical protein
MTRLQVVCKVYEDTTENEFSADDYNDRDWLTRGN